MNTKRLIAACLIAVFAFTAEATLAQTSSAAATAKTASPSLVGELTKQLSVTPKQAAGGAGALFGFAKTRLSPTDFSKVSAAVPGMSGLLKAAPSPSTAAAPAASSSTVPSTAAS